MSNYTRGSFSSFSSFRKLVGAAVLGIVVAGGAAAQEVQNNTEVDLYSDVNDTPQNVEVEQKILDAERRALEAERRAIEAERKAFELEKKSEQRDIAVTPSRNDVVVSRQTSQSDTEPNNEYVFRGSIGVFGGYNRAILDGMKRLPLKGFNLGVGGNVVLPLADMVGLDFGLSFRYVSASMDFPLAVSSGNYIYEFDVEYTANWTNVNLDFGVVYGETTKHIGGSIIMSDVSSGEEKLSVSGTIVEEGKIDSDPSFGISIYCRYDYVGGALSLPFEDGGGLGLGLAVYVPIPNLTKKVEIIPSFSYSFDDDVSELGLGITLRYVF